MIWTAAGWIWIASVLVVLIPALSATCTENPELPLITGVPLIVPVVVRVIALGRAPELTDHE